MLKAVGYLQSSELVAGFQRRCGLLLLQEEEKGEEKWVRLHRWGSPKQRLSYEHDSNSNYKYNSNGLINNGSRPRYKVRNRLLYYLFLFSAHLGQEVFYITFLPCIHWNLDPFLCRRLVNVWIVVMYIGQVMKDVLKMPRPLSPPVVKLESRVIAEYGMPSTHAMAATAIFYTFLFSAAPRIQFQFEVGLLAATVLSSLVCLSRLYTGMHSALDVICGVLISATLMLLTYPAWDLFDQLQLTSPLSPLVAVLLPFLLSYSYPELDHYSTTRGDTTIILGSGAGCSVGYWVSQQLGDTYEPQDGFPIALPALTARGLGVGGARFLLGVSMLVATRYLMKSLTLRVLCYWHRVSVQDQRARQRREIEVPYKFITYMTIGLVHTIFSNRLFSALGLL